MPVSLRETLIGYGATDQGRGLSWRGLERYEPRTDLTPALAAWRARATPHTGLRLLADARAWPDEWAPRDPITLPPYLDYPSNWNGIGDWNETQGVATDGTYWYFTSVHQNFQMGLPPKKVNVGASVLRRPLGALDVPCDLSINVPAELERSHVHFGDPDWCAGFLYVPLEGDDGGGFPHKLVIYDTRDGLKLSRWLTMPADQSNFAWCAVRSAGGSVYLYTSSTYYDVDRLRVYLLEPDAQTPTLLGDLSLLNPDGSRLVVHNIQGGVISSRGHIYLVDDKDSVIHGFDLVGGRRRALFRLYRDSSAHEFEGLTLLNHSFGPGQRHQLHVVMLDNNVGTDDVYFKHYGVREADIGKI